MAAAKTIHRGLGPATATGGWLLLLVAFAGSLSACLFAEKDLTTGRDASPEPADGGSEPPDLPPPDLAGPCVDQCTAGEQRCGSGDLVETCLDLAGDGCLVWISGGRCTEGYRCEAGSCVPECLDECVQGERRCATTGGYQVCQVSLVDGCRRFEQPILCQPGEKCDNGQCVDASTPCEDACRVLGERRCSQGRIERCGEFDEDPCREWGLERVCGIGWRCSTDSPECVPDCTDDCGAGTRRCLAGGVASCGNFDPDPCLDWSTAQPCPAGRSCQGDGVCVADCQDECTPGQQRCAGDQLATCGQADDDPCLEWEAAVDCPAGFRCDDAQGSCQAVVQPCVSTCQHGAVACRGAQYVLCSDYDDDGCDEWGPAQDCPSGLACVDDRCPVVVEPRGPLINEVLFDDEGTDGEEVFIELWGPPGLALNGHQLVAVNGDGKVYDRIPLTQTIPASGFYLVVTDKAIPALADLATQVDNGADLQNGPDSLRLVRDEEVLDALGYGEFGPEEVFAGEGTAAPIPGMGVALSRDDRHQDSEDNSQDFHPATPTPGR